MPTTERYEVVVVGGGQAGLAIGHELQHQGRNFTILDAGDGPASAWRSRWDSLRLFTPARYNGLPGLAFPGEPDYLPTRDEVVEYLTGYAERFSLPIEYDSRVTALTAVDDGYLVQSEGRELHAGQVVVATGPFQVPRIPGIASQLGDDVVQLHSADYRAPDDLPDGTVLVVGGGNTGYQVAEELSETRDVHLAIGSRQMPLPQRLLGRDLFWYLTKLGLMSAPADSRVGAWFKPRATLVGYGPRAARRAGVQLHPRATTAGGSHVGFADGSELKVAGVVWATGFGRDDGWIDAPVFDDKGVVHQRGVTQSPGLYFLGLAWQHTRASALLGGVRHDAVHIAEQIASYTAKARTTALAGL